MIGFYWVFFCFTVNLFVFNNSMLSLSKALYPRHLSKMRIGSRRFV